MAARQIVGLAEDLLDMSRLEAGGLVPEPRDLPLWKRSQVSREGVTCVSCHRVSEEYARANGERRIVPGTIFEPVYGPLGGAGVATAVQNAARYSVATDDKGYIVPVEGALLQEVIDVAVIFNALRALRG